jgi:eukaryotic-like serine/threonine-protein kinase
VAVHDWGEHDEGAFLILQLVDGVSLRDVLRVRGTLTPAETLAVLVPPPPGSRPPTMRAWSTATSSRRTC